MTRISTRGRLKRPAHENAPDERARCDTCGQFLGFAELAFSQHHFVPLNEFGPEESSWTGPCCRYRSETTA